jgi:hypothetical protein
MNTFDGSSGAPYLSLSLSLPPAKVLVTSSLEREGSKFLLSHDLEFLDVIDEPLILCANLLDFSFHIIQGIIPILPNFWRSRILYERNQSGYCFPVQKR